MNKREVVCPRCGASGFVSDLAPEYAGATWRCARCHVASVHEDWKPADQNSGKP